MTRPSRFAGLWPFLAIGALLLALAGRVGRVPLLFDAFSVLLLHVAAGALLLTLVALARRRLRMAAVTLIAALIAASGAPEAFRSPDRPAPQGADMPLRVVSANLFYDNAAVPELAAALDVLAADIMVTVETPTALWAAPGPLADRFAHRQFAAAPGRGGIAIWSRFPLRRVHAGGNPRHLIVEVAAAPGAAPLRIMGLHLDWPVLGGQSQIYSDFNRFWRQLKGPTIVAGDFNAAPWSAMVARVESIAEARVIDGWRPSWFGGVGGRAGRFFVPGGLPIDHILTPPEMGVRAAALHVVPGSDHRAVAADLLIPARLIAPPPNDGG